MQLLGNVVAPIGVGVLIFTFVYIVLIMLAVLRAEPPPKKKWLDALDELGAAVDWSKLGDVPIDLWVRYIHRGDDVDTLIATFGNQYGEAQIRAWVEWMDANW